MVDDTIENAFQSSKYQVHITSFHDNYFTLSDIQQKLLLSGLILLVSKVFIRLPYFLHTIPYPEDAPRVQSKAAYSISDLTDSISVCDSEKMQVLQSLERRDEVLKLSSPPTTGIATPGLAGFWKSGL